jgi:hypothetical protein
MEATEVLCEERRCPDRDFKRTLYSKLQVSGFKPPCPIHYVLWKRKPCEVWTEKDVEGKIFGSPGLLRKDWVKPKTVSRDSQYFCPSLNTGPAECEKLVTNRVSCSIYLCAFSRYRRKVWEGQQAGAEWRRPDDASSFVWLLTPSFNKQPILNR